MLIKKMPNLSYLTGEASITVPYGAFNLAPLPGLLLIWKLGPELSPRALVYPS